MASIAAKSSIFETSTPVPSSPAQWRTVLQEIKLLYTQRQYKRCLARSSFLLRSAREPIHPVHKTYVYFYSAISYEAMGRYAHDYSRNKIPLLHSALDCFVTCLAGLPAVLPAGKDTAYPGIDASAGGGEGIGVNAVNPLRRGSYNLDISSREPGTETEPKRGPEEEKVPARNFSETSLSFSPALSRSPSPLFSTRTSARASRSTTPTEGIVTSITDIIDKTLDCACADDPFLSDYDCDDTVETQRHSGTQEDNHNEDSDLGSVSKAPRQGNEGDEQTACAVNSDQEKEKLKPSPLHVRKPSKPLPLVLPSINTTTTTTSTSTGKSIRPRPPPFRLLIKPSIPSPAPDASESIGVCKSRQKNTSKTPTRHPTSLKTSRSTNRNIASLHTQLTSSISSVKTIIREATALQEARAASRRSMQRSVSFWSFSPVEHPEGSTRSQETTTQTKSCSRRETKDERIARLRADGWRSVGLRNAERGWKGVEYYKELCGRALDELYLGV
ncbi:hypothetical protein BJX61DRAFT_549357 [Aspergillus egyptiacus]|nr:hypothetical protein BJX61DRAFT_549357 [Aspergillus egyptiacus]